MKCPVCRAPYRAVTGSRQGSDFSLRCRRCGVDLAPLIQVYDQAIWHHRQAIEALKQGDVTTALAHNHQALALYQGQADFHALEAQLQTLQGEFGRAITACQKAQQLDPQHPTAVACLQWIAASGFRQRAHDS